MRKIVILIAISVCFLTSCNDFLYVEPDQQISINEQLSTKEGVLEAYIGIYTDIEDVLASRYQMYADLQGGNITFTPSAISKILSVPDAIANSYSFSDQYDLSDYEGLYEDLYGIINQVNTILEYVETFSFFSTDELNKLQAELLTIRAFAHYQIAIYYAQNYNFTTDASHLGVIYNTDVVVAGIDFPKRKTIAETYDLLKIDLNSALDLYNDTQLLSGESYSYFNTYNTQALYARIALQMNDWELTKTLANSVIQNSGVSLTSKEAYVSQWLEDILPIEEVLLEFTAPRTTEGDVSSSISSNYAFIDSGNYQDYVASGDLREMYESEDIRNELFLAEELSTLEFGIENLVTYYFTHKFQGDAGTLYIRLSEIYLIRAEASIRLGDVTAGLIDLNIIRKRAGLTEVTSTETENVLDEVFDERRRELAFEGHLLFDIARFKKNVSRNLGCLANSCNLNYPSNYFILPIPSSSADLNENLEQNEGY